MKCSPQITSYDYVLVSSLRIPMQMVYAAASTSVHFQATVSIKRAQSVI